MIRILPRFMIWGIYGIILAKVYHEAGPDVCFAMGVIMAAVEANRLFIEILGRQVKKLKENNTYIKIP